MELHLHLSFAFRALDRKWGPTVDLDTSESSFPCLPAVVDRPSTTFSSEEFLKKRHRPKPYSRFEVRRRKENVKRNDSFADISSSKIPSLKEATSIDSGLDEESVTSFVEKLRSANLKAESTASLDSGLEEKIPVKKVFRQLKTSAKSFIDKKICRKMAKC